MLLPSPAPAADVIKVRLQLARNQLAAGAKPPGMVRLRDGCLMCAGACVAGIAGC